MLSYHLMALSWLSYSAMRWLSLAMPLGDCRDAVQTTIWYIRRSCLVLFGTILLNRNALVLHKLNFLDYIIIFPMLMQLHWSSLWSVHLYILFTSTLCSVHLSPIAGCACWFSSRYAVFSFPRCTCCHLSGNPHCRFLSSLVILYSSALLTRLHVHCWTLLVISFKVCLSTNHQLQFSARKCTARYFLPALLVWWKLAVGVVLESGMVNPHFYITAPTRSHLLQLLRLSCWLVKIDSEVDIPVAAVYLRILETESGLPRLSRVLILDCNYDMQLLDSSVGAFAITSLVVNTFHGALFQRFQCGDCLRQGLLQFRHSLCPLLTLLLCQRLIL